MLWGLLLRPPGEFFSKHREFRIVASIEPAVSSPVSAFVFFQRVCGLFQSVETPLI